MHTGFKNIENVRTVRDHVCYIGPPVEHIHEVANALKKIGDELDGDHDLQR